jgi:hypothetical protein
VSDLGLEKVLPRIPYSASHSILVLLSHSLEVVEDRRSGVDVSVRLEHWMFFSAVKPLLEKGNIIVSSNLGSNSNRCDGCWALGVEGFRVKMSEV